MEDIRFLPNNFTELSSIVKLSANAKFEKVKPWDKKKNYNDLDEKELEDPEVYFTFSVSWDIEPEEIVEKVVMQELRRGGGRKQDRGVRVALFEDAPDHDVLQHVQ